MITFVNVFTVLPEKQADALQKIQQVYVEVVKHLTIPKSRHHPPGTLREAAPRLRQFDGTETDTAD